MLQTNDMFNLYSESNSVFDTIHYTGGEDEYTSEERNTHYYADIFNSNTKLAIFDNIAALTKVKIDENGNPVPLDNGLDYQKEEIVSTDDRLYIASEKNNIKFLFDVGIDNNNKAITTASDGLFVLSNTNDFASIAKRFINKTDSEIEGAFIYIGSFFGYDTDEEGNVIGKNFDANTNFFSNGRIETIAYETGTNYSNYSNYSPDFSSYVANIASSVASWLDTYNLAHEGAGFNSAFEAFNDFDNLTLNEKTTLVDCYANQIQA